MIPLKSKIATKKINLFIDTFALYAFLNGGKTTIFINQYGEMYVELILIIILTPFLVIWTISKLIQKFITKKED